MLTTKKTSVSVEEAKIDYDVYENRACQASKQTNKEERTMKTTWRRTMKKMLALLLTTATLFMLSTTYCAAEDKTGADLLKMQLEIDGKVYTLSGYLKDILAQGITVTELEDGWFNQAILVPGYWYSAKVGETQFRILLSEDRIADDVYVSGLRINQISTPNAEYAGLRLGKTTYREIQKNLGDPHRSNDGEARYYYKSQYAYADFDFESAKTRAPLKQIEIVDATPFLYGPGVSEQAGVEDDNLPNPEDLQKNEFILDGKFYSGKISVADLMENGWRLNAKDVGMELKPRSSNVIGGTSILMYNGIGLINVSCYNSSTDVPCSVEDGMVLAINVKDSYGTSILTEKGFTNGANLKDVEKAFDNIEVEQSKDFTKYHVKADGIIFRVVDKTVIEITVIMPVWS